MTEAARMIPARIPYAVARAPVPSAATAWRT